jgi:hypothetical protein
VKSPRRIASPICLVALSTLLATWSAAPAAGLQPTQPVVVSADPANWTPNVQDGKVLSLLQIGNRIIAGGVFTSVKNTNANGGQTYARTNIFAFNATTGVVDTAFSPSTDGEVSALAAGPDGSLFIAGNFRNVDGQARRGIAKLDPTTGALWAGFSTVANGRVRDLVIRGSRVFVGGNFSKVGGANRVRLGAFNAVTGAVDPLNLPIQAPYTAGSGSNVLKLDVTPSGDRLVMIGNFSQIAGANRWQLAVVDLTSNALAPWNTDRWNAGTCSASFKEYPRDVEFAPDGSYFVVVSTGAGYWPQTLCDTASRWPTYTTNGDVDPDWIAYSGGDTFFGVGVTGSTVYVGGHMRWMNDAAVGDQAVLGAVSRPGIAALDPQNGVPYDWNPVRNPRGLGVFDFLATDTGLWFGSDTSNVGGEQHARIAFFPVQGGHVPAVGQPATLPGDLFSAPATGLTRRTGFTGSAPVPAPAAIATGVNWANARGTFYVNGTLYAGWSDGRLYGWSFNGSTLGAQRDILQEGNYVLGPTWISFASFTGMYWDAGRLYYTRAGDSRLFYRYFSPDSELVGSVEYIASGNGDGLNWSGARGVTFAGGRLFYASLDGNLHRVNADALGDPTPGTDTVIAGPLIDGVNYLSNGMFVRN